MKNMFHRLSLLFLGVTLLFSCRKVLIKENSDYKPTACFNQVWQTMNDKYTFFDYKHINWDSIKMVYLPQVNDNMSEKQLFELLSNVIGSVRDGHTSLYSPFDTFKYYYATGYDKNYFESFIQDKYLSPNDFNTSESIKYCKLNGNIGYIYYPSFKNELTQSNIDNILNSFSNTKGIIIDIRNNTGGDNKNIFRLIEHFVSASTKVGITFEKKNSLANSFTEITEINVGPKGVSYTNPIMVLTNRTVYSSANIFAGFMSQLPQVKLIGDITGGGTGIPTSDDLPNGWRFRFSSSVIRLANNTDFENGILPDFSISTDSLTQISTGKDAIIEKAILEIL